MARDEGNEWATSTLPLFNRLLVMVCHVGRFYTLAKLASRETLLFTQFYDDMDHV